MAAPPGLLHLPFAAELDESQADELLDPGAAFLVKQNVRQDLYGSLTKRLGFTSLALSRFTGSARASGLRCFMNADQICTIDSTPELDVYSTSLARSVVRGRVPECSVRLREIPSPAPAAVFANLTEGDTAVIAGGSGGTYVATGFVVKNAAGTSYANVALFDADNGAVVLSPQNLEAAFMVTLATYSTYVLVFLASGNNLKLYKLDVTSATTIATGWVLVGTLATDYTTISPVTLANDLTHAVTLPSGGGCAIAYKNTSGGANSLTVRTVNQAGNVASTTIAVAAANLDCANLSEGGSVLWLSWNDANDIKAASLNETTLAVVSAAAVVMTAADHTGIFVAPRGSGAAVYVNNGGSSSYLKMVAIQNSAGTTATAGSLALVGSARLLSQPFVYNSRAYAHVTSSAEADLILCDVTADTSSGSNLITYLRPVAAPIQRELINTAGYRTALIPGTTKYLYGFSIKRSGSTIGAALAEYDFASAYRWKPAPLNTSTFLSGGVLSVFDGTRTCEAAFLVKPVPPAITSTASAGSVTLTTGRLYVLTFTDIDADGNVNVSGVSAPSQSTGAVTSKQIDLAFPPISITSRGFTTSAISASTSTSSLRVEVWGTLDGGSTYYRVGEVTNDPNDDLLSFTDNVPDATLATRPLLYGTGSLPGTNNSSQDHRAPPGLTFVVSYNGMLVGAQGATLYFSSQLIDGEGTWFSPAFTRAVDEEITGLAVQDGAVLVFTRAGVWAVSGEPPSDNALQGGLSVPRRLAVDQGCVNANSIVTTALGTFYQSGRGIELLTRGYTNTFIGDKVPRTLASFPMVTSAVLDTVHGIVRFSLAEEVTSGVATGSGRTLIYDLVLNRWESVDTHAGTSPNQASQDAMMAYVGGAWRYAWLATGGTVYYERATDDASAHLDGSTWVTMVAETASFKVGGLQGKQFVNAFQVLERKATDHNLSLSLAYNYESSFRTPRTWTRAEINDLLSSGWPTTQLRHNPHDDAECQSVRARIEDATPTGGTVGTGKGASWLALSLDVTQKPGLFEVPEEAA